MEGGCENFGNDLFSLDIVSNIALFESVGRLEEQIRSIPSHWRHVSKTGHRQSILTALLLW
jgi:hypothetical protein